MLRALVLALANAAFAAEPSFPACRKKDAPEPAGLSALLDCQDRRRAAFIAAEHKRTHREVSGETLDALDAFQRREVRDYLKAHPERAAADGSAGADSAKAEGDGLEDLEALKADLAADSEGGKLGVTPDMAKRIVKELQGKQGFISPEMRDLLQHLSRDGPNLTHASVRRLKTAAQDAKGKGLDLGVDPDIEKFLLSAVEDTPDDETGPDYDKAPPPTN